MLNGGSMVWGFCVYFVYMIPLETDVLRKHRFQKLVERGDNTYYSHYFFQDFSEKSPKQKKTSTVTHIFYSIIRFFMKISL